MATGKNRLLAYAGIDLSLTTDLTAYALVIRPPRLGNDRLMVFCRFYLPEPNILELEREAGAPYTTWAEQGWLTLTPNLTVDYDRVRADLNEDRERVTICDVSIDPYNASEFTKDLQDDGFEVIWFQRKIMGSATKEVQRLILERKIVHDGNPILRWNIANTQITFDRANNPLPVKSDAGSGKRSKRRYKIDGTIAMIMAVYRSLMDDTKRTSGYSKERGLQFI